MNVWLEAALSVFAVIGIWTALCGLSKLFLGEKKKNLYVFLNCGNAEDGTWDIIVRSPDEDRILKALGGEYEKIYVQREVDRWSETKSILREQSKK